MRRIRGNTQEHARIRGKYAVNTREYADEYAVNTREYADEYARIRENTREYARICDEYAANTQDTREYAANTRICRIRGEYARIRENTQQIRGYAASTRANTHQYAANTQEYAGYAQGYSANTQEYAADVHSTPPRICVGVLLYHLFRPGVCACICLLVRMMGYNSAASKSGPTPQGLRRTVCSLSPARSTRKSAANL